MLKMKKQFKIFLISILILGTLCVNTYALTPGPWDLDSAYDYVQKIAEEKIKEQDPGAEEEKPEIPESQLHMLHQAIAEQIKNAKKFFKISYNRGF